MRLSSLAVVGNIGTHADGTPYTYIGLNLGPLYYYPSMLGRASIPGWEDDCIESVEAIRTVRNHHISLCYLPEVSALQLEMLLHAFNRRLADWIELRFRAEDRLERFVVYKRTCLLDVPYQLGATGIHPIGRWVSLRRWDAAQIADAYWARRFADTWRTVGGQLVQRDPNALRDLLALSANNKRRYEEAVGIVQLALSLPIYNDGYSSVQEWPDWLPCFLTAPVRIHLSNRRRWPTWYMFCFRPGAPYHPHHRFFAGERTPHFKVQSLGDLHVTPVREADGTIAVRFTCPRFEVALGQP